MSVLHVELFKWGPVAFTGWKVIGWTGAFMFTGRWIVQLVSSRRRPRATAQARIVHTRTQSRT